MHKGCLFLGTMKMFAKASWGLRVCLMFSLSSQGPISPSHCHGCIKVWSHRHRHLRAGSSGEPWQLQQPLRKSNGYKVLSIWTDHISQSIFCRDPMPGEETKWMGSWTEKCGVVFASWTVCLARRPGASQWLQQTGYILARPFGKWSKIEVQPCQDRASVAPVCL